MSNDLFFYDDDNDNGNKIYLIYLIIIFAKFYRKICISLNKIYLFVAVRWYSNPIYQNTVFVWNSTWTKVPLRFSPCLLYLFRSLCFGHLNMNITNSEYFPFLSDFRFNSFFSRFYCHRVINFRITAFKN